MNAPTRLIAIVCTSLLTAYLSAGEHTEQNLAIKKTTPSISDLFNANASNEILIVEQPFPFPDSTAYTQWAPIEASTASAGNRFYLALDSLSQGTDDRIFRYAVKLTSRSGTENIRFEGLQCENKIYRMYAFGNPDGSWTKTRNPKWQPIVRHVRNDYTATLFDAFCLHIGVTNIEKIKKRFER